MTITLEILHRWLLLPTETENLEFKEAKQQFDSTKLLRYCVAIANERGGYLVLGVTDKPPRQVVGTQAFSNDTNLNSIKSRIVEKLQIRVDVEELFHPDGRVVVFIIPSRPVGQPIHIDGTYLMRAGEDLVPMTPDVLRRIFDEGKPDWFMQAAYISARSEEVISLLDTQSYFEMLKIPYPTRQEGVLERFQGDDLIVDTSNGWTITNLAAILFAKHLASFSPELARKGPRVVIYESIDKTRTRLDYPGRKGYATGFKNLIEFVHSSAPQNRSIEQVVREEVKMFPLQALRELIANALVHQDFLTTGSSVMIEMYPDRVEISNPGIPPIDVKRFIDEFRSRNERLAEHMRRLGICEEKGSGIDKVVQAAEIFQLPAPDFRVSELRTIAVLFAHKNFSEMNRSDRVRACYQHCCLMYVTNQRMSNQSLRQRFNLSELKAASASQVISMTKEEGLIKADESETMSMRYARYLPYWA